MAKAKKANYSEAEIAVISSYKAGDNAAEVARIVNELAALPADQKGEKVKAAPSVRAKLSSMGVYVKEEKATATGGKRKADIAEEIGVAIGLSESEVEGLTNATAAPLAKVLAALTAKPEPEGEGEDSGEES